MAEKAREILMAACSGDGPERLIAMLAIFFSAWVAVMLLLRGEARRVRKEAERTAQLMEEWRSRLGGDASDEDS
jgi:hypothetical protein